MRYFFIPLLILLCVCCVTPGEGPSETPIQSSEQSSTPLQRLSRLQYVSLQEKQEDIPDAYQKAFPFLLKASAKMDEIFWKQSYGSREGLLDGVTDTVLRKLILLNYGPYDRLDDNAPLISGIPPKAPGANFYPVPMADRELQALPDGLSKLTLIQRNAEGDLIAIPYSEAYSTELAQAAKDLRTAADHLAEGPLKEFLFARATAFETDQYPYSDGLWLDLDEEDIDILIGPIESYEDALKGIKSGYQACIVQKDNTATDQIGKLLKVLSQLKLELNPQIRYEKGSFAHSESVGVYNALHFSGLFNAGSKSMGLNAPHFSYPPEVESKGKRRLILKNIIEAKYKHIVEPIGEVLLDPEQKKFLTANAFFQYVLFHELSHGWELVPSARKNDNKSIQEYLLEYASILEEGKGDILGLYMITQAYNQKLSQENNLESHFVTSLVNTLRAVRFGRTSDHAIANTIRLNFFLEEGAYVFDKKEEKFRIVREKMEGAIKKLAEKILRIQASGDAHEAMIWTRKYGRLSLEHERLLDTYKDIPVDLRFQ